MVLRLYEETRDVLFEGPIFECVLELLFEVIHCTMVKNNQKLMKLHFQNFSGNFWGKQIFVNFYSFLVILRCITVMRNSKIFNSKSSLWAKFK